MSPGMGYPSSHELAARRSMVVETGPNHVYSQIHLAGTIVGMCRPVTSLKLVR